jgi:DNA-binding GntR family transcriptional regulator
MKNKLTEISEKPSGRLLREQVYEQLRADILALRLRPGMEVREADLAELFQVSKSPVRDALLCLEQEGLVITLPRQGYRIAPVSLADVQDMFYLRATLEGACIRKITQEASDDVLASLDKFRSFDPDAWEGGFVEYNRCFHRTLAEMSGNGRMRDYLFDLIDQMERVVLLSVDRVRQGSGNTQVLVDEHCRIIDGIQARQLKPAEKAAEQHITLAGKRVYESISNSIVLN